MFYDSLFNIIGLIALCDLLAARTHMMHGCYSIWQEMDVFEEFLIAAVCSKIY